MSRNESVDTADRAAAARMRGPYAGRGTSKRMSYDAVGDRLLKVAVVFLSTVNALMWEYYTESRMMAIAWAAIAIGFVVWIISDVRR